MAKDFFSCSSTMACPAEFDHNPPAVESAYIGQGLQQDPGFFYGFLHGIFQTDRTQPKSP